MTSSDPQGIQILVTSELGNAIDGDKILKERYLHFEACKCKILSSMRLP